MKNKDIVVVASNAIQMKEAQVSLISYFQRKIDTPWGKKGDPIPERMVAFKAGGWPDIFAILGDHENYHDLFEQIEVKSDQEVLTDFIFKTGDLFLLASESAQKLLSLGIVTEEGMKKVRGL